MPKEVIMYIQEIELLLQTAERIDEEMQRSSSEQLLLTVLTVLLVIVMLFMNSIIWRVVIFGPLFWTLLYQYQIWKKQNLNAETKFKLIEQVEPLIANHALELSTLTKYTYTLRIDRLKS